MREALFLYKSVTLPFRAVYVAQTKQQTLIERIQRKINKSLTLDVWASTTETIRLDYLCVGLLSAVIRINIWDQKN